MKEKFDWRLRNNNKGTTEIVAKQLISFNGIYETSEIERWQNRKVMKREYQSQWIKFSFWWIVSLLSVISKWNWSEFRCNEKTWKNYDHLKCIFPPFIHKSTNPQLINISLEIDERRKSIAFEQYWTTWIINKHAFFCVCWKASPRALALFTISIPQFIFVFNYWLPKATKHRASAASKCWYNDVDRTIEKRWNNYNINSGVAATNLPISFSSFLHKYCCDKLKKRKEKKEKKKNTKRLLEKRKIS